jgi:N-acetyl-anhydromuramyl-L-alanine amidase AmpD
MHYYEDPQLRLTEGSKDQNVLPSHEPNVPENFVRELQADLNALGYAAGKADGWFGPRTTMAVKTFQQDAKGTVRQEQGSASAPGRTLKEEPPLFKGESTGVVDGATAQELQRWKEKRWQRPSPALIYTVEDIRDRLPINPRLQPRLRRPSDIDRLVLHCTDAAPDWGAMECARYDIGPNHISSQGCPTITYTYFVNADGRVQQCLSHTVVSWHVGDWNYRSLGIVLAYRATGNSAPPPAVQLQAAAELFARLCQTLNLKPNGNVVGHRELPGTGYHLDAQGRKILRKECPGLLVDLDEFRRETARRLQNLATASGGTHA